ncbi:uncharacterized protein LOC124808820 [Hydra vulgaris]|uniref:uncharacterized protein LOC124808820 n=1 Tax=Hydra vulgaris TaxID=6087 RepID=UPI001F5F31BB|nr:uncharacterized protein LOC124808820 [Hydra vulgaris]
MFYNKLCQKSDKITIESIELLEGNNFSVPSFKNSNDKYIVNSDVGYCSCISGRQGGFCKHMAAIHKLFKISFPCAPPITSDDRYELGKLALGLKCPKPEFFLNLRDINEGENETISTPIVENQESSLNSINENDVHILSLKSNEEKIASEKFESIDYECEEALSEFRRLLDLAKIDPESKKIINSVKLSLKNINTTGGALAMLLSLKTSVHSNKRNGKIKTQPTAGARRRKGLSHGSRTVPMGRPTKIEIQKRFKVKRPRDLKQAVSQNVANAKSH